jgi:hypothetical protein
MVKRQVLLSPVRGGLSAYHLAKLIDPGVGSITEWLQSLRGKSVEMSATDTHIRWREVGTTDWQNLVTLADLRGSDGTPGQAGEPGRDGAPGKSAYDVALENGYVGTAAQWLASLQAALAPHSSSHAVGGADAITPQSIGAANSEHDHDAAYQRRATVADDAPTDPEDGDEWLDTTTGIKFVWYGGAWVDTAGMAVTQANVRTALATGGNVELPSTQAATNPSSAMTRMLGDARYGQIFEKCLKNDESGAVGTTAYTQSNILRIDLPVGSWALESLVLCSAGPTFSSSGSKSILAFSGTQTNGGRIAQAATVGAVILAFPNIVEATSNLFAAWEVFNSSHSIYRTGIIDVTVAGTLSVYFGACGYNAASTPVLNAGSYLKVTKV